MRGHPDPGRAACSVRVGLASLATASLHRDAAETTPTAPPSACAPRPALGHDVVRGFGAVLCGDVPEARWGVVCGLCCDLVIYAVSEGSLPRRPRRRRSRQKDAPRIRRSRRPRDDGIHCIDHEVPLGDARCPTVIHSDGPPLGIGRVVRPLVSRAVEELSVRSTVYMVPDCVLCTVYGVRCTVYSSTSRECWRATSLSPVDHAPVLYLFSAARSVQALVHGGRISLFPMAPRRCHPNIALVR